ncbi:RagB/SusD family nutrient uptake outer membrane protein [Pedobacter ureilyticus]|uniref:RagB/SusD family nutrient uptake outer membrane protein n=1 Tax=Pedobacter ureilyticus TaxID=1393051 RepID=A0ABW9J6Z2_9SPHI|nr:RagB/SusD family nutrient uptake outer membrane protein [Pedobacter helvus]
MKRYMKYKYFALFFAASFSFAACKKQLEEQKPQASLDASSAYTNAAGVRAGIFGVYNSLQSSSYYGLEYNMFAELGGGNLSHVGTFPTFAQIANNQILPDNVNVTNDYNAIYSGINNANTLIAAIPNVNDGALDKNAALAELRTLRALMYFDLIRYFGGSPTGYNKAGGKGVSIKLTPTLAEADATPIPRSTEAEVYTQILSDLDFAIGVPSYAAKITNRAGKNVAIAIKARLQLYREQWPDAEAQATTLISATGAAGYSLVPTASYGTIWSAKNTSESIFELDFNSADQNSIAFYYYPTTAGGRNEVGTSADLNAATATGDVRKAVNFSASPAGKTTKFTRTATGDDNVVLFRLAEIYLIRAEARVRQNTPAKIAEGLADLNVIRVRANLLPLVSTDQTAILNDILAQRRIELAHEGHRWFDLRRYNLTSTLGISQPFRALWPIPQREVLTSGNIIEKNDGY